MPLRCGSSRRSTSTAWTCATRSARIARQHAEPRPDLEHDVVRLELGQPPDHAEDVLVDEEVLAEALARSDAHSAEHPRSRCASICASSSAASTPRSSASASSVWHDVRRLVALAAHRLRREIRAVGLGEQPVGRDAASRVAQVVGVLVGDVAGERHVPAVLERRRRAAAATRSSGGSTGPSCASEACARVVVGRARVDDDRLAGLACELELRVEQLLLRRVRRVVAEVVEAGLADGDRARDARAARAARRAQVERRARGLVRVDAEARVDAVARLGARERAPRARRCVVATSIDAGRRRRSRARSSTSAASSPRCAWVSITPRRRRGSMRGKSGGAASIAVGRRRGGRTRPAPSARSCGWPSAARIFGAVSGR